jgi:hypothetical protein
MDLVASIHPTLVGRELLADFVSFPEIPKMCTSPAYMQTLVGAIYACIGIANPSRHLPVVCLLNDPQSSIFGLVKATSHGRRGREGEGRECMHWRRNNREV